MRNSHYSLIILLLAFLMTACSGDNRDEAQGYIEGRYTYMATPVSGVLKDILVSRGTNVKVGQVLFSLDAQPEIDAYEAALEQQAAAVSDREAILANIDYAQKTFDRNTMLVLKNAIQQSQLDEAVANLKSLEAQSRASEAKIKSSEAAVKQAKWLLDQKKISAPIDAVVFDTFYRLGEYTEANHAILSLLAPADIKVIFYVPEPKLAEIKLNGKVNVLCDKCEKIYSARVSFISPTAEYTPPVIFSKDTNEKLIYRIEAEFDPSDAVQMHPGQPVQVVFNIHE